MAALTVTSLVTSPGTTTPVSLTMAATSSNGDTFSNTGAQVVLFQNSSSQAGAAVNVTVTAQARDNYGDAASLHSFVITIPSSSMALTAVGPFRPALFNDASGNVNLTYSAAGLYVKVVSLAPAS